MALDKLVDSAKLDSDLNDIADAILAKSGGSSQIAFPAGFVREIQTIPIVDVEPLQVDENGTYAAPSGKAFSPVTVTVPKPPEVDVEPLQVSENGTYNAPTGKAYSPVVVEVPAGDPNENLEKANNNTLTSISSNMTQVKQYLFAGCTNLTQINFPALTTINTYAFYKCGFSSFVTENYVNLWSNCFRECANLETVVLKGGCYRIDISVFERCTALQAVDCASFDRFGINGGAFYYTGAIEALILRQTDSVVNLSAAIPASSALTTTGYIYVPAALVDTYKAATNWSVVASRITSIEGSYYETHYANGTPIPAA